MAKDKKAMDADTKEKEGDDKLAKDKKAMDADEEQKKLDDKKKAEDKKAMDKKAMDAEEEKKKDKAEDKKAMDSISELRTEIEAMKRDGLKTLMGELNRRNEVAKSVEAQFGTFDHAELTTTEVAQYGLKKAGMLAPAGAEVAVWDAYCGGRKVNARPNSQAMDSKEAVAPVGSLIEKTLKASK